MQEPACGRISVSVTVALRIVLHRSKPKCREVAEAGMTLRIAMTWRKFSTRYSHAVILLFNLCIDNPARHYGEPFLSIGASDAAEVKPLTAGVRSGKLF